MAKVKVIDPGTGKEKVIKVNDKPKSEKNDFGKKLLIWIIVSILVIPSVISALYYLFFI